jgi:hypothetical protein
MKALQRNLYFFTAVLTLSSCANFENLTDDRTRAEDDEMYWNGKELFYDNALVASAAVGGDDYYDPNSASRSNSVNGGTNPRAAFNPISGWQLSYGLNAFSNYSNAGVYGMGFGSSSPYNNYGGYGNYGNSGYGYNPYGNNSYGYNPYSSYNPYGGGYGYNPYGYGMGGLGWGGNGYGNGWYGNNNNGNLWGGGSTGNGETTNVTHHHRRPASVGTGNSSTYHRGVLQKNLVEPIAETSRTPNPANTMRANGNYSAPVNSRSVGTPEYTSPGRNAPNYNSPTYSTPSRSTPSKTSPSQSSPSRSTPSYSSPTPSRSTHSSPSKTTTPSHSSPSRSTSPNKRP